MNVKDLARACVLVLESDKKIIRGNVFGVGDTRENYQKKMIVDEILKLIPDGKVKYVYKDEDPRNYRVDFTRIKDQLGFEISRTVPDGIAEVAEFVNSHIDIEPSSCSNCNAVTL